MSEFVSPIQTIPCSREQVYAVLSDLSNLEKVRDRIPTHHMQNLSFDRDSLTVSIPPVGQLKLVVVDREAPKTIKWAAEGAPVALNLWLQLVATGDNESKMKLTVKVELNPFLKGMVAKPLQEGLDKMAAALAQIPYDNL